MSLSVWLAGLRFSHSIKRKMDVEDGLLELVDYIKKMICAGGFALFDIYHSFYDKRLDVNGFFDVLRQKDCDSLKNALLRIDEKTCDKDFLELIKSFASNIGSCYNTDEAVTLCDKYLNLLKVYITPIRDNDKKREQMYSKLSFICACGLFVLCI